MFHERIPSQQLSAWLFAGLTPVLIQLMSNGGWIWTALAGITSLVLTLCLWRSNVEPRKWLCAIQYIYVILLLGQLLLCVDQSWPKGDGQAITLILLALGAWSAQKGPSAAARVGAVLFWAVLIVYLVAFGAGVKDLNMEWLKPQWKLPEEIGFAVYLIPAGAVCLLGANRKWGTKLTLPALFALAGVVITAGVLSPKVAQTIPNAFYEVSRSINLSGVARRFEALISAVMTVGWFCIISLLLTVSGVLTQKIFEGWGRGGVWTAAAIGALSRLCGLHISPWMVAASGAVFWVALPLLTQGLGQRKKS